MATNAALRLRRSAAQMHALAQVEREIRATDPKARCRYLRDFTDAFRSYQSVLTGPQLVDIVSHAEIILVGDYHALPASQHYAALLLQQLATTTGRPVVLGVEAILSRHQHVLEEWMRGEIDESELRERVRFDIDWGYDWQPYCELLRVARGCSQRIYGLDCTPRTDLRRILARDRHAASKIVEMRAQHPEAVIVVLFGESHLAPGHLPSLIHAAAPAQRVLTVLQNVDPLYWQAAGESREHVDAVLVRDDVVCVFNSTPLDKYESYRLCIDRWRRLGNTSPDLAPSLYNLIEALARFLNIDKYAPTARAQPRFLVDLLPEVLCRSTEEQLERLLARKALPAIEMSRILERIAVRGACLVPSVNAIFATSFQVEYGAEEAARFVHHACQGTLLQPADANEIQLTTEDRFYARVVCEALAYFGSRVLYPSRPAVREGDLYALYAQPRETIEEQTTNSYREYMEMIDFLVLHKDYETHQRHYRHFPDLLRIGLQYTEARFEFVTEKLGQMLGTELYDAYVSGSLAKRFLRSLFMRPLERRTGAARAAYYAAVRRLAKPRRRAAA